MAKEIAVIKGKEAVGLDDVRGKKKYLYSVLMRSIESIDNGGGQDARADADAISNAAGKVVKLMATEILYGEHIARGRKMIDILED
ncbi:hypothetical protein LQZ19_08555 [Treponema primitia]|uniref:hypothetical protein n=1 Tax=Treponema primitia TaxID=88058 RepID=UPI003980D868